MTPVTDGSEDEGEPNVVDYFRLSDECEQKVRYYFGGASPVEKAGLVPMLQDIVIQMKKRVTKG